MILQKNERYFEPVEKVMMAFKEMTSNSMEVIDTGTLEGKRLRGELLVHLKNRAGLKYK